MMKYTEAIKAIDDGKVSIENMAKVYDHAIDQLPIVTEALKGAKRLAEDVRDGKAHEIGIDYVIERYGKIIRAAEDVGI